MSLNRPAKTFPFSVSVSKEGILGSPTIPRRENIDVSNNKPQSTIWTIGITPNSPNLFFDLDVSNPYDVIQREIHDQYLIHNEMVMSLFNADMAYMEKLREYIKYKERTMETYHYNHYHWAIYLTKHGYHLVYQMPSWSYVSFGLRELNTIFQGNDSIMNYQHLWLRITAKWDITKLDVYERPLEVSFPPILYEHCGNSDISYTNCKIWERYHNEEMGDWDIRGEYKNPTYLELYRTND